MMGKVLVTHQTGPEGKEVKRLYIEEASDISKEFYLSCLIDRETSKIALLAAQKVEWILKKLQLKLLIKLLQIK
jgi:succinyl-CoA synthetase beta subunit